MASQEQKTAKTLFISYASEDNAVALQICGYLERSGVACWIAPRDIEPGTDYPSAIVEAIEAASALVVVLTENATGSPHVLTEIGQAFDLEKPILPFRISTKELPDDFAYFLSMTQWLDAHEGATDENLQRLLAAAQDALAGKHVAQRLLPKSRKGRVAIYAGLALLVFAAAAALYWRAHNTPIADQPPKPLVEDRKIPEERKTTEVAPVIPQEQTPPQPAKPRTWVNPKDGLTYSWIPPGSFTMGCSPGDSECRENEKPSHLVEIEKGFWIGQTEVTREAYRRVKDPKAPPLAAGEANMPVTEVSWPDAKAFCAAVDGRLPTEAEWEYAARGGRPEPYYGSPGNIAWYAKNSEGGPHPVKEKKPNAFGLYDTLGNVSEWVLDRYYNKYYADAVATGDVDQPLPSNASAVARGGFWESEVGSLRVSRRVESPNTEPVQIVGFRCASDHSH